MGLIDYGDPRLLAAAGLLFLIGWVSYTIVGDIRLQRKYRFPNLVPGLPIVGNALQMPSIDQGPYLYQLSKKYGELLVSSKVLWVAC